LLFAKNIRLKNIAHSFFGLLYISLSWGLMMDLRSTLVIIEDKILVLDYGYTIPLVIIFSIWINDTMAYIVGSFIGKNPLSKISPKKTWEGTIGGIILSILLVGFVLAPLIIGNPIGPELSSLTDKYHWFIIAAIAAIFGTFGDLLESKLKRLAGVKDSGSLMPGHGGFLDRFDSLLLATPFVWLYVQLFMR
jgi:phosphatidate cytidylyltransferase